MQTRIPRKSPSDTRELKQTAKWKHRFVGREITQDETTLDIRVTCKDNAQKILPINFDLGSRDGESKASEGEMSQLMSVNGSMAFVARMAQPWQLYGTSRLQSVSRAAQVKHLNECNEILQKMTAEAELGLFYKAFAFSWNDAIVLSIGDASWANDVLIVEDTVFPRRSQYGRIQLIASPDLWDGDEGYAYYVGAKSGLINRVCPSTMKAETHGQLKAKGEGDHIRSFLAEISGKELKANWLETAREAHKHLSLTDCKSFEEYVNNPVAAGTEDKRLEIDLEMYRQDLWENPDGSVKDFITENERDRVRWIDTSTMLADCLTKRTKLKLDRENRDLFIDFLQTGCVSLKASAEAELKKIYQAACLKKASEKKKSEKANANIEN